MFVIRKILNPGKARLVFLLALLFATALLSNSQTTTFPVDELKKAFPDEDVIIYRSTVDYTVEVDKKNVPTAIVETWVDQYVSLRPNVQTVVTRFYDDYSEISKHDVNGTGSFNKYSSQRCGDYEINGIFYHDAKVCEFLLNFNEAGEHLKVTTIKKYKDLRHSSRIALNSRHAIKSKTVTLQMLPNIDFDLLEMNFAGYNIEKSERSSSTAGLKLIEYQIINVPSYQKLDQLPGSACAFPHLLMLIKGYEYSGKQVNLINNVDALYKWYSSMVTESTLNPELAEITEELANSEVSDSAKIATIYYWVQDKIRYLAFENGSAAYVPDSPGNVYKNMYGDCKGMANLTKTMLRHIGYDARLSWVYSGNTCYTRDIPSPWVDNHMICAVKLDNSFIFLDPTMEYSTLFSVSENIQGKECLIEDGENYFIETIPATNYASNLLKVKNDISIKGDQLIVDGSISMTGQLKNKFQYFANHLESDVTVELINYFITNTDNNIFIDKLEMTPHDTMVNKFDINYSLVVSNTVLDVGKDILLTLDFYNEYRDSKIDTTRKYDLSLSNRQSTQHEIYFNIPENTNVSNFPDSLLVQNPKFEFSANYAVKDSVLIYRKNISIKDNIIKTDEFDEWNSAIDQLVKFYNKMIILEKK